MIVLPILIAFVGGLIALVGWMANVAKPDVGTTAIYFGAALVYCGALWFLRIILT